MFDLGYSIFAAQNLIGHGTLVSLNMLTDYHDDLAHAAQLRFMVHFPPGQSLLYAAAMSLGLSAGAATKLLVLLGILIGGSGWLRLARYLKASSVCLLLLAIAYPWLPFSGSAYTLYETEHVAAALMPWFCLLLLQLVPFAAQARRAPHRISVARNVRLAGVVLLAAALVSFKYSMSPVFLAAALFLLALDGRNVLRRPFWWKAAVVGLLVAPLVLGLAVNHAYGPRIVNSFPVPPHAALLFVRDAFENSISAPFGWRALALRAFTVSRWQMAGLVVDVVSLALLAALVLHLRKHPPRGRMWWFAVLLAVLTVSLWLGLAASSIAGQGQWNFSTSDRLYMPIVSMWLLFALISLTSLRVREVVRTPAFYLCAAPVSLIALFMLKDSLLARPLPAMPHSGIAWTDSRDVQHATFLAAFASAHAGKPDLMIGPSALMNEIEVPSMSNGYLVPAGHHYRSSRPLEVWALVWPAQQAKLLADFAGSDVERVTTPPGYPFAFYIFKMRARDR